MPSPPTLVQDVSVAMSTINPKTTDPFDVLRGDLLVTYSTATNSNADLTISNSGADLGWSCTHEQVINNRPAGYIWAATCTASITGLTVTISHSGSGLTYTGTVLTFRDIRGVGSAVAANAASGQPSVEITTAYPNSTVVVVSSNEGSGDLSGRVWNEVDAGVFTELSWLESVPHDEMSGYHADAGLPALKTVGATGTLDGFKAWVLMVLEIITSDLPDELQYTRVR